MTIRGGGRSKPTRQSARFREGPRLQATVSDRYCRAITKAPCFSSHVESQVDERGGGQLSKNTSTSPGLLGLLCGSAIKA